MKVTVTYYPGFPKDAMPKDLTGFEVCDGEVVAEVRAIDQPEWGGCRAELAVSYVCQKCGNPNYPALPTGEKAVSEALTSYIALL